MADSSESAEAWTRVWLDAQKQFLDAWQQLSPSANTWTMPGKPPFSASGSSLWGQALDQWSRMASLALPQSTQDVAGRLAGLGKSYLQMGETFWKMFQQTAGAGGASDWQALMNQGLEQLRKATSVTETPSDPWCGFATLWGLPLDTWKRIGVSLSPFPGEMEKALRGSATAEARGVPRNIEQLLGLPPLGYTREWQEQLQEWTRLSLAYAGTTQEFARVLAKVAQRALELMGERLTELSCQGESLGGLRAAYDLWVDCGEAAYAETLSTPEFPALQAELVNALMRLKRHEQRMLDEVMTGMNMPTRRELDTSHKRVYELRRELRALQACVQDMDSINELREQLEELRDKVDAPQRRTTPAAGRSAKKTGATPKTPVRKKASTKTAAPARGRGAQPKSRKD
jgi:class III poly(R)-hydroxyalkanoic acid synthase PhaE subunit